MSSQTKISLPTNYDEISQEIEKLLEMDSDNLDAEQLKTVRIIAALQRRYNQEAKKLKDLMDIYDKVYLNRWKHYNGLLDGKHYREEPLHIKPVKSDVEKYLKGDERLQTASTLVQDQDRVVKLIEDSLRQARGRGFDIKNILEFRKMMIA